MADVGTEPEPLHHSWTKPFDEGVRLRHQIEHSCDRLRLLEVERDRALVAIVEVEARRQVRLDARLGDPVDPQDVGAEIAEQRSSEWRRTDPAHLDDAKAVQRSRHDKISSLSGGTGRHRRWSRGQRALR